MRNEHPWKARCTGYRMEGRPPSSKRFSQGVVSSAITLTTMHCFRECLQSDQAPHLGGAAERPSLRWTREALDVEGGTAPLQSPIHNLWATMGRTRAREREGAHGYPPMNNLPILMETRMLSAGTRCAPPLTSLNLDAEMSCRIPVVGDPLCDQRPNGCNRWCSELPMKEAWRVAVVALCEKKRVETIKREQIWVLAEHG